MVLRIVNVAWKSNVTPRSTDTNNGILPTMKSAGVTQTADLSFTRVPGTSTSLNLQMTSLVSLKQGPDMNTWVPPNMVPTNGNRDTEPAGVSVKRKCGSNTNIQAYIHAICQVEKSTSKRFLSYSNINLS